MNPMKAFLALVFSMAGMGSLWAQGAPPPVTEASELDGFIQTRITRSSDPGSIESFRFLCQDSTPFRNLVLALFREQPKVILAFETQDSKSFGDVSIQPDPQVYEVHIRVQHRAVRRGKDMAEPWLAGILYAFLDVSRMGSVIQDSETDYHFSPVTQQKMWAFQKNLRSELRKSNPARYAKLARSGDFIYENIINPSLNRVTRFNSAYPR